MTEPAHRVLDFHSPRRPPMEAFRLLSTWHASVCLHVQEAWASLLAQPVTLQAGVAEPMQHHTALGRLPEDGVGVYFTIGEAALPSMVVFTARQIRGLVADLLDLPADDGEETRRLTAVEEAMLELLFQKMAEGMGEGWPGADRLKCRYLETTSKPQRTRIFPPGSAFIVSRIKIRSRFGEDPCLWLMLKEETERMLLDNIDEGTAEERNQHPSLVALAEKVPMQVVVELGRAEITMSQAAELNIGDVLVLDQFVSRPLLATVDNHPKWAGTPLRIGSRQGFAITQVVDDGAVSSVARNAVPTPSVPTRKPT